MVPQAKILYFKCFFVHTRFSIDRYGRHVGNMGGSNLGGGTLKGGSNLGGGDTEGGDMA